MFLGRRGVLERLRGKGEEFKVCFGAWRRNGGGRRGLVPCFILMCVLLPCSGPTLGVKEPQRGGGGAR